MHISKSFRDEGRKIRRSRSIVFSTITPSTKTLSVNGEDFELVSAETNDNFLGIGKLVKKITGKAKSVSDKKTTSTGNAAGDLFNIGAKAGQKAVTTTSKVSKPIADIVDYGGGAVIVGTGITAAVAPSAVGLKGLGIKALAPSIKAAIPKAKEKLIEKGRDLATEQIVNLATEKLSPRQRENAIIDPTDPSLLPKTRESLALENVAQNGMLQAGTPLTLENPLVIGAILLLVLFAAFFVKK